MLRIDHVVLAVRDLDASGSCRAGVTLDGAPPI
jgi:hypothetical protein